MQTSANNTGFGITAATTIVLGLIWLIIYAFKGMTYPVKIVGFIFIAIIAILLIISIIRFIISLFY